MRALTQASCPVTSRPQPPSALFPYTTLFRSDQPAPVSAGSMFTTTWPYWPLPPDWRMYLPSTFSTRRRIRSEDHTSELQSPVHIVCPLLLQQTITALRHALLTVARYPPPALL